MEKRIERIIYLLDNIPELVKYYALKKCLRKTLIKYQMAIGE